MTSGVPPESPKRFPKIMALIEGTVEASLSLGFIDLCGTTAYVGQYMQRPDLQASLTRRITAFGSALANVAKECPSLQVVQASDGAFLLGESNDVLDGIIKVMLYAPFFYFSPDKIELLPMRAAIADGIVRVETNEEELSKYKNLYGFPYWGPAFVKTHFMEKTKAAKGIQIFATEAVISKLSSDRRRTFDQTIETGNVQVSEEGSEKFYHSNWLALVPPLADRVLEHQGLDPNADDYGLKYLARIIWTAEMWMSSGDPYYQMYGQSILELKDTLAAFFPIDEES